MKKIISMGIASAVLALTAIAASADIKATTNDKAINGKTITVEISTTTAIESFGFTVSAAGLETALENVAATTAGTAFANINAEGTVLVSGFNAAGYKAGDVLATITYTVTAETGSDIAVTLGNMDGYDEATQPLPLKVVAEEEPGTSEPGTSEPGTEEPGTEEPGTDVPGTGVALAVVPAVLAGAAVVVAKKRR